MNIKADIEINKDELMMAVERYITNKLSGSTVFKITELRPKDGDKYSAIGELRDTSGTSYMDR